MLFINRLGKYQETQGFNTSSRGEVILKSNSIFLKIIERGDHAWLDNKIERGKHFWFEAFVPRKSKNFSVA